MYTPSRRCNIALFGAMMDGETDDSGAIQEAIDACGVAGGGTVDIPAGKVLIEDVVRITYDNVVLRGAGKDRTVIQIPHSLLYIVYNVL